MVLKQSNYWEILQSYSLPKRTGKSYHSSSGNHICLEVDPFIVDEYSNVVLTNMALLSTGLFRNYEGYANCWVKSIVKKTALSSIHANALDMPLMVSCLLSAWIKWNLGVPLPETLLELFGALQKPKANFKGKKKNNVQSHILRSLTRRWMRHQISSQMTSFIIITSFNAHISHQCTQQKIAHTCVLHAHISTKWSGDWTQLDVNAHTPHTCHTDFPMPKKVDRI